MAEVPAIRWAWPGREAHALLPAGGVLDAPTGTRLRLWAGARHLHVSDLDASLPLAPQEQWPHARGVFVHYLGAAATQAPMALWRSGPHRGACLLHGLDLVALRQSAQSRNMRLVGLHPLWAGALAEAWVGQPALRQAARGRLLVVEGDVFTEVALADGHVASVRVHRLDAAQASALADWLQAEPAPGPVWAIGHGLAGQLQAAPWRALSRLDAAEPWCPQPRQPAPLPEWPDLLAGEPQALAHRWGWALAATAGVVLAVAAQDTWQALRSLEQARKAMQAPRLAPQAAPSATQQALQMRLRHPWGAVFSAAEAAAADGVRWLSMEHAAQRPELRLVGVADSAAQTSQVAEQLARQRVWREVLVTRLRPREAGGGMEFELGARLESVP